MRHAILPNKYAGEIVTLRFDFSSSLQNDTLVGSATVSVTPYAGTDVGAAGTLVGVPTRTGNVVTQNMGGGVDGVIYSVTCACASNAGANLEMQGFVACLANPL